MNKEQLIDTFTSAMSYPGPCSSSSEVCPLCGGNEDGSVVFIVHDGSSFMEANIVFCPTPKELHLVEFAEEDVMPVHEYFGSSVIEDALFLYKLQVDSAFYYVVLSLDHVEYVEVGGALSEVNTVYYDELGEYEDVAAAHGDYVVELFE